jgi:DNA-binding transcriptional LysR family regulator
VRANVRHLQAWLGFALGHGYSPYVLTKAGEEFVPLAKRLSRNIARMRIVDISNNADFELEWIEIFTVLQKYKSQAKAAGCIGISQAGVSRKIIDLENYLGYSLFERDGSYRMTDLGEQFCAASSHMHARLYSFRDNVRRRIVEEEENIERNILEYNAWLFEKALKISSACPLGLRII